MDSQRIRTALVAAVAPVLVIAGGGCADPTPAGPATSAEGIYVAALDKDDLYLTVTYVTAAFFPLYPDDDDELTLQANLEVRPEQGPGEKVVG